MKACQDIVLFCSTAIVGWSKAFLLCDCILAITDNTQENWQSFYSLSEIVSSIKIMLTYKASINVYVCQSNATWLLLSRSHARSHGNICTQSLMYKFTWVRLAFIGTYKLNLVDHDKTVRISWQLAAALVNTCAHNHPACRKKSYLVNTVTGTLDE